MKRRIGQITKNIRKNGLDGLLLTSPANVSYVTGFGGDDSWALIFGNKVWLITDSRYTEQAQGECVGCRIYERTRGLWDAVGEVLGGKKQVEAIGVESTTSLCSYNELGKVLKGVKLTLAGSEVSRVRRIKADFEIKLMSKAARISKTALAAGLKQASIGITESELAGLIEFEMRKLGAMPSFETIAAFGANGSRPHHVPGSKKLRKNDTILIDYGCKYEGYCSDMTRCFATGRASEEYIRAYEAVKAAQAAAIKAVRSGVKASAVDEAARLVIREAGFPEYGHGTGHGLGIEVHEGPTVSSRNDEELSAGMVITIEPGIYLPGRFGIRIEDDAVVTEKGCRIITRSAESPELEFLDI